MIYVSHWVSRTNTLHTLRYDAITSQLILFFRKSQFHVAIGAYETRVESSDTVKQNWKEGPDKLRENS